MREWGRIVLVKRRPKREIQDAAVGGMLMYLMAKHFQLIIVLVRLCGTVLVPFSRIYTISCKFYSFTSPELVHACVCKESEQEVLPTSKDKAQVQRTPKQVLQWFSEGGRQLRSKEIELQ